MQECLNFRSEGSIAQMCGECKGHQVICLDIKAPLKMQFGAAFGKTHESLTNILIIFLIV